MNKIGKIKSKFDNWLTLLKATVSLTISTPPANSAWYPSSCNTRLKSANLGSFMKTALWPWLTWSVRCSNVGVISPVSLSSLSVIN